jgi:hypothetical protein
MGKPSGGILECHCTGEACDLIDCYIGGHPNPANCRTASYVIYYYKRFKADDRLPNPEDFRGPEFVAKAASRNFHLDLSPPDYWASLIT